MSASVRRAERGNSGIGLYDGHELRHAERFPVGTSGPCDGLAGSPARRRYEAMVTDWVARGLLPERGEVAP